jgi:hypothetical protein
MTSSFEIFNKSVAPFPGLAKYFRVTQESKTGEFFSRMSDSLGLNRIRFRTLPPLVTFSTSSEGSQPDLLLVYCRRMDYTSMTTFYLASPPSLLP